MQQNQPAKKQLFKADIKREQDKKYTYALVNINCWFGNSLLSMLKSLPACWLSMVVLSRKPLVTGRARRMKWRKLLLRCYAATCKKKSWSLGMKGHARISLRVEGQAPWLTRFWLHSNHMICCRSNNLTGTSCRRAWWRESWRITKMPTLKGSKGRSVRLQSSSCNGSFCVLGLSR